MDKISIYIHYPFCFSKCPYCDFNSYANLKINEEILLSCYIDEIGFYSKNKLIKNKIIKSIFFGGGTPSLMNFHFLEKLLNFIKNHFIIDENCEISIEANPSSTEINKLNDFKSLGINRLSLGIQALNEKDLKFLGRTHSLKNALEAIEAAQKIFSDKYSIDLIYARPNQKIDDWVKELEHAIKLSPYHLSLYQLIIEEGTYFYKKNLKTVSDEEAEGLYKITKEVTEENNIFFYEVSNYAKKGYESKHNLNYWSNGEWIGIGAGAHGRISFNDKMKDGCKQRLSISNLKNPIDWIKKVKEKSIGYEEITKLSKKEIIEEFILMGLRKRNGITLDELNKNVIVNNLFDIFDVSVINFLKDKKVIEVFKNSIKVKEDKFFILDSIIEKLL